MKVDCQDCRYNTNIKIIYFINFSVMTHNSRFLFVKIILLIRSFINLISTKIILNTNNFIVSVH